MSSYRILIVEDEVLIADNIKRYLTRKGHQVVGMAISYDEAVELFSQQLPDICLLDIKLSGHKSGIDVAHFIEQQPHNCPFIYLTSQMDAQTIEMAKATLPAGYLSKPIHKEGLFATLEIVMHKQQMREEKKPSIPLFDGTQTHLVELKDILFLQSDHIYLQVYLSDGRQIIQRNALKDFMGQLPADQFVQTHRSYVINLAHISRWDNLTVYMGNHSIPISRSRKKEVHSLLSMP